uniref:Uncharacterized protein n=1 Tax=Ralstonia syzygii R24 TaxID=907261 RepID=G3A9X8_9RALS|nr:hypothetical protein RALSY_mp10650 [Ralstonia syzygii R24]
MSPAAIIISIGFNYSKFWEETNK